MLLKAATPSDRAVKPLRPLTRRRSPLYQREGDPGFGVYDADDPGQAAALRLRYVLLGEGFPAVAMGSVVGLDKS